MSEAAAFRRRLMRWYREHGRHGLPWRQTRNPYAVLVSEVMLQQTQVARVLPYYTAWLERWPDFAALASASPAGVIREWRGLGYNRRALNFHRLAVAVAEQHGGKLPADHGSLQALPGIGPYTASALRSFARGERVPVADTNIARVSARAVLGTPHQRESPPADVTAAAIGLLPARNTRDHNLALMDLGALVCTARAPACGACPVATSCRWNARGRPPSSLVSAPIARFETTARFARGRIVDLLRESPMSEDSLAVALPPPHRPSLQRYLAALSAEGLIIRVAPSTWSLPH